MHLGHETVADALTGRRWDLDVVAGSSEVADVLLAILGEWVCPEGAADEDDGDGVGFFVGEGEERLGCVAVHELDAKDLGLRE